MRGTSIAALTQRKLVDYLQIWNIRVDNVQEHEWVSILSVIFERFTDFLLWSTSKQCCWSILSWFGQTMIIIIVLFLLLGMADVLIHCKYIDLGNRGHNRVTLTRQMILQSMLTRFLVFFFFSILHSRLLVHSVRLWPCVHTTLYQFPTIYAFEVCNKNQKNNDTQTQSPFVLSRPVRCLPLCHVSCLKLCINA